MGEFEYAVPTDAAVSGYDIALAAALIERMHQLCVERGIRFIVVDIPTDPGSYRYQSSVPSALLARLVAANVEYISSQTLLQKSEGVAEMHVPHGHHHISEYTHMLIGMEIGERMHPSGAEAVNK